MTPQKINEYRVVPRIIIAVLIYILLDCYSWGKEMIPDEDIKWFIGAIAGSIVGGFLSYMKTGGNS